MADIDHTPQGWWITFLSTQKASDAVEAKTVPRIEYLGDGLKISLVADAKHLALSWSCIGHKRSYKHESWNSPIWNLMTVCFRCLKKIVDLSKEYNMHAALWRQKPFCQDPFCNQFRLWACTIQTSHQNNHSWDNKTRIRLLNLLRI